MNRKEYLKILRSSKNPLYKHGRYTITKCLKCGHPVSLSSRSHFCRICWIESTHIQYPFKCKICHVKISYAAKLCRKHYIQMDSKFKRGKLNPGWKGKNRYNGIWMINRLKVLKRDDHKCRWCLSSKKLEVHHIFPVVIYNMYNVCKAHKLINLITLCKKHHNLIHGK